MSNILKIAGAGVSAAAEDTDENFNQTVLLLHGDGTDGDQNNEFLDSGTANSGSGFTITRNGNTTQGTFSPFSAPDGRWSNYFDAATATRLTLASSTDFAFGTGAYTVEAFVYLNAYTTTSIVFDCGSATNSVNFAIDSAGKLVVGKFGVGVVVESSAAAVPINQWVHLAWVRTSTSSNDTRLYVNGSLVTTGTDNNNWTVTTTPSIGGINLSGYTVNGYVSNLRVIKGSAITPSSVPTSPFSTSTSGQVLLSCYSNRFVDANTATTAKTVTVNGNPKVTPFSPFAPTAAYDSSVNGGSGYFDGTGDYLSVADNAALEIGANSFCIEGWIYLDALPASGSTYTFLGKWNTNQFSYIFQIQNNSGTTRLNFSYSTVGNAATDLFQNAAITANAWHHIAVTRDSTTLRYFLGGVQQGSNQTLSATLYDGTADVNIGRNQGANTNFIKGYVSNARLVIGSAVYTSGFTPSGPLTNITNTALLTNFTNAGIFDNTGKNNLETVGNAQIDTTTKKFGTGSMEFDGTGDYLLTNGGDNFVFGTGDFTIEFWLRINTTSGTQIVYDSRPSATNGAQVIVFVDSGVIKFQHTGTARITGSSLSINTWYHVAIARSGTNTKMFVDGTQVGSTYTSDTTSYTNGTNRPVIGVDGANTSLNYLNGFIDDLRITKGVARYTSAFSVPTKAFPDL